MPGVKGMKWGVRNWQNPDGSYTAAGLSSKPGGRYNQSASSTSGSSSSTTASSGGLANKSISYYKNSKATEKAWEYMNKHKDMSVGYTKFTNKTSQYLGQDTWASGLMNGHDWDWQEQSAGWTKSEGDATYTSNGAPIAWLIAQGFDRPKDSVYKEEHIASGISNDEVARVNVAYGEPGTTNNCAKCSSALLLQVMGYDVSAGRQTYPSTADAADLWWNNAKQTVYDSASDWDEDIKSTPNGSIGTCAIYYPTGGGHSMAWSKDSTGKVKICDGQNHKVFNSLSEASAEYGGSGMVQKYDMTHATPNWDNMGLDGVIRDSSTHYGTVTPSVYNKYSGKRANTW